MINKSIVFALLVFIVGSSLASDADATKQATSVMIDGKQAEHNGKPVFLSADKRQFLARQDDKTMVPITRDQALTAIKRVPMKTLQYLQDGVQILQEHDAAVETKKTNMYETK